jgi:hypothetical protein
MITLDSPRNGKPAASATPNAALAVPPSVPAFTASTVELARRMRFNPLRMVSPENLAAAHDHFDLGYLWQGALFWDAMIRRDDTLSFVVPQLQNAIAAKPWGVQKKKNADPKEAARHAAALEYFYANVTAVDAFDKNIRGDRHLLLRQMGLAHATRYAVHHFVWKPGKGKMIEVEGAAPVPALTAEMEYVPLWFFENTSGTLRLLKHGGYGGIGEDLDWQGEWMVTSGEGAMFAAAGCYIFKRLTFQDWTIYNERYGQQKVIGMTTARADSEAGRSLTTIVEDFAGDMGIALHECQNTDKPPISLLGPEGTASVDVFERFLDRQDEKMTVMFRGGAQANVASKDNEHGITAQINETEALEIAHCQNIASACRTFIDRAVIRYCFGEDVEPLAWFGLPDMDDEDAEQLRENSGFIADRGGRVDLGNVADRLGVPMADENADEADVLQPVGNAAANGAAETNGEDSPQTTANTARLSRLQQLVEEALRTANAPHYDPDELRDELGRWSPDSSAGVLAPDEARARLRAGIDTHDVFGNAVRFDGQVLDHWEAQNHPAREQDRRLRRLPDAIRAVEQPHEVWQGDKQTVHLRTFTDDKSKQRYTAGMILESGRARTFFHFNRATEVAKLRKGERLYVRPQK